MKKILMPILIATFIFSMVANIHADDKALYNKLTAHINDATGRIDAIDVEIIASGDPTPSIMDSAPGYWENLNLLGLCKNPGDPGGEGIRIFKNFPDTSNPANEIQGWATTGCKVYDNKFRVYFKNAAGDTLDFDPCINLPMGLGYVDRPSGIPSINVFNNSTFLTETLESWWPEFVAPPKPAFTAMTVQDSLDGCASFPSWNTLVNDQLYHDTDSCDYNYHWGEFHLPVNGDAASDYYLDLADGYATDVNFDLKDGEYFPFYLDTSSVPSDFYTWWDAKNVNATYAAANPLSWQAWMWKIVGLGTEPMFYIYYDENGTNPPIYKLIDGLQKGYASIDQYFRVPGDYPQGSYIATGQIEGCNDELSETVYVKLGIESCPPPTVVDITTSTLLIDDCVDTLTICVEFSEDMNTAVDPTITYTPDVSSYLPSPWYSGWTSSTTYCLRYSWTSFIDIAIPDIDVNVSGAVNEYCCPQDPDPYTEQDVFSIYTLNPTGVITLDPYLIDLCVDTFEVKICYDDAMCTDPGHEPAIAFNPPIPSGLLGLPVEYWEANDSCYIWKYPVLGAPVEMFNVGVIVSGAENWTCCNMQDPAYDYFDIDTEKPNVSLYTWPNPINGCWVDSVFTVWAYYSDSMCTSVLPTITFDPPSVVDPMSPDYTLELLGSPTWPSPANMFSWEYKIHKSAFCDTALISVTGAMDWTCCNMQDPASELKPICFETPEVDSITVDKPLLTRCDSSFTVCVYYDREMDPAYTPVIEFAPDVSSHLGTWMDSWTMMNSKYCREYEWHSWAEIDEDCVDIMVSGARGISDTCSIQEPDTCFCCFEIDWDRPEVVSILVSDLCVGSCDTMFTVTVEYDEPMCTMPYPTIEFIGTCGPLSPDPFTLDTQSWLDVYTAEINFLVSDVNAYDCDVDVIVSGAIDATCCDDNVQHPDTLFDAFDVDQIEPGSYIYNAEYNDTTCTISFDWEAWDSGCPSCISKVEFYVWHAGDTPTLVYTDATGNTYGSFSYDLTMLPLPPTLCLEGMWYGYSKAYDCCCNVENKTTADDSVNVEIEATHFAIKAYDSATGSDTLREGRYFNVEVIAVNDCGLRDCDFEGCIEGCTNYNFNIVNLTLFSNPTMIYDGYLLTEHNVAHQTMDNLIIKAWLCPCCAMYSYSDPYTVLLPPIEPPTSTSAYDVPDDQGGWISIDYTLSLNDPFHSIHDPVYNSYYLPQIDYYLVERNSASDGSGTWNAIAFVNLYNPSSGDNAHVDIQVPASDTLYPYRMAAVYVSGAKLFEDSENTDAPQVLYLAENSELMELTKGSQQSIYADCGSAAGKDNIPAYADMKVFLEGPYQGSGMMSNGMPLPTTSPYDGELVDPLPVVPGHMLIDWIYVELRSTETGETIKEANAFVLDNGTVVDTQGNNSLPFYYTTGKDYYIVILHRNHLDIMSAVTHEFGDFESESTTINLTTAGSAYLDGFKEVESGVYALYTGDASGNEQVQNSDKNDYWAYQVGQAGYLSADFNLNGEVQNDDKNDYWQYNVGKGSMVPAQAKTSDDFNLIHSEAETKDGEKATVTLTFANAVVAGGFLEYDIMMKADSTKRLGDNQVYINYNYLGFGTNVCAKGAAMVTKGTLLQGDVGGSALYSLVNLTDNTSSRFSATFSYNFDVNPSWGNIVPTTPTQLMHVKMKIVDPEQTAGLSFQQNLIRGQIYESDNITKFDVIATDTENITLPVVLASFTAIYSSTSESIELKWTTASELDVQGFNIYRNDEIDYTTAEKVNVDNIEAHGTSTQSHDYTFEDIVANIAQTHYYWLEVVDYGGISSCHGPITYTPYDEEEELNDVYYTETKLLGSWPNPAFDQTQIRYKIKGSLQDQNATISIYNIRGELVKKLNGTNGHATLNTSEFGQGIYFYKLETDNYTDIQKLVIVK